MIKLVNKKSLHKLIFGEKYYEKRKDKKKIVLLENNQPISQCLVEKNLKT